MRPLRWYERLVLRWLARSPRIDLLTVMQFPGPPEHRKRLAAEVRRAWQVEQLQNLYDRNDP